jgi:hypothetical protein
VKLALAGFLSVSAARDDIWQLGSASKFEACDFTDAVLLHVFETNAPAFDLQLSTAGRYWFSSKVDGKCSSGLKVEVVVGEGASANGVGPTLTKPAVAAEPHATCITNPPASPRRAACSDIGGGCSLSPCTRENVPSGGRNRGKRYYTLP